MRFLYPLGLLGLLGIPILILVYIIKSKYTEQTVSSTYLWTLSEKFIKRRNPFSRLTGILSLLLQILTIALISISLAHPVIILDNAAYHYCFVLDGSGSMYMNDGDSTRFDKGKDEIISVIDESVDGSTYSLICVCDTTKVVYEKLSGKEQAKSLTEQLSPVHTEVGFTDAIGIAQSYFKEDPSTRTYLVTDKSYARHDNIELINVSGSEENYALSEVSYTHAGGVLTVSGSAVSYAGDAELQIELYIDWEETPASTVELSVPKGTEAPFVIEVETEYFYSYRVAIANKDALAEDNSVTVFDVDSANSYEVLLVSERPFFIEQALSSAGTARVDVISPDLYGEQSGYGLYIFDTYSPTELPKDGSVWFINPQESVSGSGFSVQSLVQPDEAVTLSLSDSSSSLVQKLINNMSGEEIVASRYVRCGLYSNFHTLLEYKGNPIVFTGTNEYGNREVVFALDIHDSNLPLLLDYIVLTGNLLDFSFPTVIERTDYECGETVQINVVANCDSLIATSPLGQTLYLDTANAVSDLRLTEAGTYTVTVTLGGAPKEFYVFSSFPEAERAPEASADEIRLQGSASDEGFDGVYDDLTLFLVCLAVLFAADWVVYCYEKYQLR